MFPIKILFRLAVAALLLEALLISPSMAQSPPSEEKPSVGEKFSSLRTRLKQKLWRSPQEDAAAQAKVKTQPAAMELRSPERKPAQSPAVAHAAYQETTVRASPSSFRRPDEFNALEQVDPMIDAEELPPTLSPIQNQQYFAEPPKKPMLPMPQPSQQPYGSRDASSMAGSGTRSNMPTQSPGAQMYQQQPLPANTTPAMQIENFSDAQAQSYAASLAMEYEQRSGHYRNGNPRVQTAATSKQLTASQRVLRLQVENQQLVEKRDALTLENKRNNQMLTESRQALARIESAIEEARRQLVQANEKNAIQQQRIAELESENEKQVAESQRLLDSIRMKLDDVLIREITSK